MKRKKPIKSVKAEKAQTCALEILGRKAGGEIQLHCK
jgi:hypothetical protein